LVVEDDPFVHKVAVDFVIDASCEVFEAANADDAIAILEAHPEITALLTDIDMPGSMDGLKLAAVAKSRRPELVVIVVSGHRKPGAALPEGACSFRSPTPSPTSLPRSRTISSLRRAAIIRV
jgi:CheY-like chemotaxis protein